MKKSGGFSFSETLVVVIIVAALYTLAALNIFSLQTDAKLATARGDLKTIQFALEIFFTDHMSYPQAGNYQLALLDQRPRIIPGNLFDPFSERPNSPYGYGLSPNSRSYVVFSVGKRKNGKALIMNNGKLTVKGDPIIVTNGYI
jgi:general secretion pathway protein G